MNTRVFIQITKFLRYSLLAVFLYMLACSIVLRFFLPALVFTDIPDVITHADGRMSFWDDDNELLIRHYDAADSQGRCVVFFPGQHGGVVRYEQEIFASLLSNNIDVFYLAYPGYEGAAGKPDFDMLDQLTNAAVERIGAEYNCESSNMVYVGRSLGASIALVAAKKYRPKAVVIDGVASSLSTVIHRRLASFALTKPLLLLPIEKILTTNFNLATLLDGPLKGINLTIFQAENDDSTPYRDIAPIAMKHPNVTLVKIMGADHGNAYLEAGALYFDAIFEGFKP
ncbi:MAG: hypothetical protein ACI93R_001506 [Flavobacteriales bacterium]|jgi:hypothetical protein